jgi:hypothetical protein
MEHENIYAFACAQVMGEGGVSQADVNSVSEAGALEVPQYFQAELVH